MNKATDETAGPILTRNMSKRVSGREVRTFVVKNDNFTILGGQNPPKLPKIAWIGISQPNPRSRKTAIISVIDESIRLKFERQIENGKKYPKSAKLGQKGSCDHFWNFGTALLSPGRMKIEPSNWHWDGRQWVLTKNGNQVKRGHVGVTWPTFGILGLPNIYGTVKARNFKCKSRSKGVMWGHVTHFRCFATPLIGTDIDGSEC